MRCAFSRSLVQLGVSMGANSLQLGGLALAVGVSSGRSIGGHSNRDDLLGDLLQVGRRGRSVDELRCCNSLLLQEAAFRILVSADATTHQRWPVVSRGQG